MTKIKLSEYSTQAPDDLNRKDIEKETRLISKRIGELAELLHAESKNSILVIFQGMDTSGKDGATKGVFSGCSPMYINGIGFKKPTDKEFDHDFLWRIHKWTPGKGHITVFNRSHYEDVLIQRVHNWIDEEHVTQRINAINAFEKLLMKDNNTTILKFYMHLSYKKQGEKLQERMDDPEKQWKHNDGDWRERKYWNKYMRAYEDVINRSEIPWIIAPVDQRWYRNYFIASKVLETMKLLNMKKPLLKNGEITDR